MGVSKNEILDWEPRIFIHVKDGKIFDIAFINIKIQMTNCSIAVVTQLRFNC